MLRNLFATIVILFMSSALWAHEFWISPVEYQVKKRKTITIQLFNGQEFKGVETGFFPEFLIRFDLINDKGKYPLGELPGDKPAATIKLKREGMNIISYESRDGLLTYDDQIKFDGFVAHKDLAADIAKSQYAKRTVPFEESYRRFAKALVNVGTAKGNDQRVGLKHELVAIQNPYSSEGDTIAIQLFYEDAPRPDAQIELFEKAPDGTVSITLHRTDSQGIVELPVKSGHHYLVDAVKIYPISEFGRSSLLWQTDWASLTFLRP